MAKPNQPQPNTDPSDDPSTDPTLFSVPAAAERMGVSTDAVRMRVKRGTLPAERLAGRLFVRLPSAASIASDLSIEPTATEWLPDGDAPAVIASKDETINRLDADVSYLRGELSGALLALAAERERSDTLQRIALDRLESLTAGVPVHDRDDETTPESAVTHTMAPGATIAPSLNNEPSKRAGWWSRIFGR